MEAHNHAHSDRKQSWERPVETGNHRKVFGLTIGPNWGNLLVSVLLVIAPAGCFLAFVAPDVGEDISWVLVALMAILTVVSLVSLFVTAFTDPGIIPRQPTPPNIESSHFPRSKEFKVNDFTITTKYCPTCNVQRPPRCSHCAVCNNCVEKFDHHCPWTGTCIGRRNYRAFLAFIWSTSALCVVVMALCIARLVRHDLDSKGGFWESIKAEPAALILLAYVSLGVLFVGGLSGFHLVLIYSNQTTYEHFRHRFNGSDNPYSKAPKFNCLEALCGRTEPYTYTYDPADTRIPEEALPHGSDRGDIEMGAPLNPSVGNGMQQANPLANQTGVGLKENGISRLTTSDFGTEDGSVRGSGHGRDAGGRDAHGRDPRAQGVAEGTSESDGGSGGSEAAATPISPLPGAIGSPGRGANARTASARALL